MNKMLLIAAGGALGTVLRYAVSGLIYRYLDVTFPWGTLAVNVIGCFVIGVLWSLSERVPFSPGMSLFLFIGTLGAFTTFSTYGLESFNLIREGEIAAGVVNVLASNVFGLAAVFIGFALSHYLVEFVSKGGA